MTEIIIDYVQGAIFYLNLIVAFLVRMDNCSE